VSDGRDNDFSKAKELLRSAERIYFMGFGFNNLNVERLGIQALRPNKSFATAFGLTTNEIVYMSNITRRKGSF
jgi:DNA-binding MurR/RpiR family transcriptional regulator